MATGQDKLDVPFIAFVHFALIVVAIGQGQHGREQVKDISSGMKTIMLTACPTQAGAPRPRAWVRTSTASSPLAGPS